MVFMALGKAFIEVHADTKPFARELEKELSKLAERAEKGGSLKAAGEKLGSSLATGISEGIDKDSKKVSSSVEKSLKNTLDLGLFSRFSKGIIDSLDDGFSGLPAEIKVALGAALLAITPFLGASIAGVVGAAITTAFAGIGTLLAFQFDRVRLEGSELVTFLRDLFTTAAKGFVQPVIDGIRVIEERFAGMAPTFTRIFDLAATFIEPLVDGLAGFFENLLPGLEESLNNATPLVETLSFHFKVLGKTIGDALLIITGTDNLDAALHDFLTTLETIILMAAILIRILTELWSVMKLIISTSAGIFALGLSFDSTGRMIQKTEKEVGGFQSTLDDLVAPTQAEEKALKEINDQLASFITNTGNAWQSNINFEDSLDDMSETLKKNKGELDLNERAGQANQQAILNATLALIKQRDNTIALTGDTEKANATFEANRLRLQAAAVAAGISAKEFENLTSKILLVPPPITVGVTPGSTASVNAAAMAWIALRNAIIRAGQAAKTAPTGSFGLGTFRGYADGGVVTSPTLGLVGEAGPEAIIPLSNPARAAQVMNEAGLSGGTGSVAVYIGNEQLNAFIDRRVDTRLSMTARSMSYGVRAI